MYWTTVLSESVRSIFPVKSDLNHLENRIKVVFWAAADYFVKGVWRIQVVFNRFMSIQNEEHRFIYNLFPCEKRTKHVENRAEADNEQPLFSFKVTFGS